MLLSLRPWLCLSFLGFFLCQANAQKSLPVHQQQESKREGTAVEDRQVHEDLQAAARYWYESRNPKQLPEMEEALNRVLPLALKQSPWVISLPTWEEAHQQQAYHDAGAILLAKCYTLLYYGRVDEAKAGLELVDEKFPYALMLLSNRTAHQVRKNLHYHEQACALYAAIISKKMDVYQFPPERDEFDAEAQKKAAEDMAMLRLREGNYDALDHYASQARLRQLKTASGQWVSDFIYQGMHPLEDETWSKTAWDEMGDRILEWRQKKPQSVDARIGELVYELARFSHNPPRNKKAIVTAVAASQKILAEIGPVSPLVTQIQMTFSLLLEEDFSVAAEYFNEGYEKFPDYPMIVIVMHLHLAKEPNGQSLSSKFLTHIGKSDHPETLAMVLADLPPLLGPLLTQGMDLPMLKNCLRRSVEVYPHSLALRNDVGRLAVVLKMPDVAREIMLPVGSRWDRKKWQGMEEEAARLTEKNVVTKKGKTEA